MYRTHFLSGQPLLVHQYKQYVNLLNRLKKNAKDKYYANYFQKFKNNLKQTWKLIGALIKRKTKGQTSPARLVGNGKAYVIKQDIANQFNEHVINVGSSLAESIDNTNIYPTSYIKKSPSSSFAMSLVNESILFSHAA